MKKYIVIIEVDEKKLEETESDIEGEFGWLEESGIYLKSIEEIKE